MNGPEHDLKLLTVLYSIQPMDNDRIKQEYTEDQIFILQDIADEQRAAMEDEWDEDKYFSEIDEYLSDIAVSLMMEDHD
jgi:hypothetical protein